MNINESVSSFMKCDKEAFVKTLLRDHHSSENVSLNLKRLSQYILINNLRLQYLVVIKNISMDYELNNMLIHKILLDRLKESYLVSFRGINVRIIFWFYSFSRI